MQELLQDVVPGEFCVVVFFPYSICRFLVMPKVAREVKKTQEAFCGCPVQIGGMV